MWIARISIIYPISKQIITSFTYTELKTYRFNIVNQEKILMYTGSGGKVIELIFFRRRRTSERARTDSGFGKGGS